MEIIEEPTLQVKCPSCFALLKVKSSDIELVNIINSRCICPCCGREIFLTIANKATSNIIKTIYTDENK